MVCPYCKNEMEIGFIQSPRPIFWSLSKKIVVVGANKLKGDIPITTLDDLTSKEAYYCKTCESVHINKLGDV